MSRKPSARNIEGLQNLVRNQQQQLQEPQETISELEQKLKSQQVQRVAKLKSPSL
ncbi:MAG: hypothetical protein IM333_00120 [Microcystis sp. M048S1]|nr:MULTISPECIES: hypothetical protein [Microcystis]MCA2726246.1 hypothetical protein [Microcystis sp. M166S2]MCA2891427.1 hypothetical protein [Microcystis sp. M048S1]MCA2723466.1 hypothetical protein [Microcystis sp. M176S2]MCA2748876.1 hypothetical protein [Microcystis sp. M155S2]MCA2768267.1 hypothetical protein [Microcystis sp. M152S2]